MYNDCSTKIFSKLWGEQWRDAQDGYFKEKNKDLKVDLNHLIPERHQGRIRDSESHYLKEDNALIKVARVFIALHQTDNLINHISLTHSVFTRRDVEQLIFKTVPKEQLESTQFRALVERVLQHNDVICLGANDEGKDAYTTKNQYLAESALLHSVEDLSLRFNHVYKGNNTELFQSYQLNDEQREAFDYITQGADISVVIGRPGVGKSYLLKPLREYYEAQQCNVIGAALSGKVAKAIQSETGIASSTLASLTRKLDSGKLTLSPKDILIVDEAGMVDFAKLSTVINYAHKAQAKVVLVGDPDQLKPINKGEIFRGIASRTGFIELSQIRRQRDAGDREASLQLSQGKIAQAITYYNNKGCVRFANNAIESASLLVENWQTSIKTNTDIKERVMFAFSRVAVESLNEQARDYLKQKEVIGRDEYTFERDTPKENEGYWIGNQVVVQTDIPDLNLLGGDTGKIIDVTDTQLKIDVEGEVKSIPKWAYPFIKKIENKYIQLAQGERILFRKNDTTLGVRNGDMAFIESVNAQSFTAKLDSGEKVTIPKSYKYVDYGYATTVHKGQGMTVDKAYVLIDSKYWDRFLSFVAFTRHRDTLKIYADHFQHTDIKALTKTLSRSNTKDNVIDWPLDASLRLGFSPDKLIGRVINHLAGVGNTIKNKFNYLVHYEAYARQKMTQEQFKSKDFIRSVAKKVADYLDEQAHYISLRCEITFKAEKLGVEASSLPEFKALYNQSVVRDQKAHDIWTNHQSHISDVPMLHNNQEDIQRAAARHDRYLVIKELASFDCSKPMPESLIQRCGSINLEKDKVHVAQLATQFNKKPSDLMHHIEGAQQSYRKQIFNQLKKEHPLLAEYTQLLTQRSTVTGFKAEQLDKLIVSKAKEITKEKHLYPQLQRDLPQFAQSLLGSIKNYERDRSRAR